MKPVQHNMAQDKKVLKLLKSMNQIKSITCHRR